VPDHTLPLDGSRWRDSIYSIDRRAFDATHTTAFDRLGSRRKELGPPFVLAPILVDVEVAECAKQKKYLIDDTYMKLVRLSGHRDTAMRSSAVLECRAGWRGEEKARGVRKKKEEKRKATGSTTTWSSRRLTSSAAAKPTPIAPAHSIVLGESKITGTSSVAIADMTIPAARCWSAATSVCGTVICAVWCSVRGVVGN
jgi:hypothetical protein